MDSYYTNELYLTVFVNKINLALQMFQTISTINNNDIHKKPSSLCQLLATTQTFFRMLSLLDIIYPFYFLG